MLSIHLRSVFLVISFPLAFLPITYTRSSSLPFVPHVPPPHPPRLYNFNYTWRREHIMKLLVMQLSPPSSHSIPLWYKYSQHPVPKHPQFLCSSLTVRVHVSHPYRNTGEITVLYILTFTFFDSRREDKRFWTEW
jgi:hypothetical protein